MRDRESDETRFWVLLVADGEAGPSGWWGVADEEAGGVVAYFRDHDEAVKHAEERGKP